MSKIQRQDVKTVAQLISGGAGASDLINDAQIYVTANSINKQLSAAITDGDIGGGGGGAINLITNPSADVNVTGAVAYADAAGVSPVDGTGGSPTSTITRTTSTPLRGAGSFLFTKPASNVQGEGFSMIFDCPLAFRAKVLQIQFSYLVGSGTFVAGSQSASSDLTVWVVGVTSGRVSQPTTFKLFSNSTTIADQFISNFQSSADDTQYRLCFHVGSTSTAAFTLKIDDITVSPTTLSYGTPITDWQAWTPVSPNVSFGTITGNNSWYRRVGQNYEMLFDVTVGLMENFEARITIPGNGVASANLGTNQIVGTVGVANTGANYPTVLATANSSYLTFGIGNGSNASAVSQFGTAIVANSTAMTFFASVPIQGLSAQVQSSDVNDQRIVVASYYASSNKAISGDVIVDFDTRIVDTHSAVTTGASWKFTAPIPGMYDISGGALSTGTTGFRIFKNGTAYMNCGGSGGSAYSVGYGCSIYLIAGEEINFRPNVATTIGGGSLSGAGVSNITISRRANPASITSTETIAASYYCSVGQSSNTSTPVNYDSKEHDTHNAVTTGAGVWKFTAPTRALYSVSIQNVGNTVSYSNILYKNGSAYKFMSVNNPNVGQTPGTTELFLNAGEFIDIRTTIGVTMSGGALSGSSTSHVSIKKVGI